MTRKPAKRRSRNLRRVLITFSNHRLVAQEFGMKFSRYPLIVLERADGRDAMCVRRWRPAGPESFEVMLCDIGRALLRRRMKKR